MFVRGMAAGPWWCKSAFFVTSLSGRRGSQCIQDTARQTPTEKIVGQDDEYLWPVPLFANAKEDEEELCVCVLSLYVKCTFYLYALRRGEGVSEKGTLCTVAVIEKFLFCFR